MKKKKKTKREKTIKRMHNKNNHISAYLHDTKSFPPICSLLAHAISREI